MRAHPSLFVETLLSDDPWDYQRDMLDFERDRQAFRCGRQVGKSRMCAWRGLHKAVTSPDTQTLITAPTQRQSSELFAQVKKEMSISPIPEAQWQIERETRTQIKFANGSRIICLPTGNDGSTIRGYTADLIIVDEAAFIDREIYEDVLEPMLATTDGTMILASTPWGTSGYFYDACTKFDGWDTKQVPMAASPLITEEYIDRQRRNKSTMTFKQEVLGEFVSAADAFFPEGTVRRAFQGDPTKDTNAAFLGVDLARHGMDSSVFLSMDAAGNVFHLEASEDVPLTDGMGRIRKLHDEHEYDAIYIDETGLGGGVVDTLSEKIREVEGVKFTIDTKQSLYNGLKERMEAGEIALPEHRRLRSELVEMRYELTSAGKTKIHHPDGGHDDFADALALANHGRQTTPQMPEFENNGISLL